MPHARRTRPAAAFGALVALTALAACAATEPGPPAQIATASPAPALKAAPPQVPDLVADQSAPIPLDQIPGYTAPEAQGDWFSRPMADGAGAFSWTVLGQAGDQAVSWGPEYSEVPGVLTFRGGNYRSGGAYGAAKVEDKKLTVEWRHPIHAVDSFDGTWYGAGWTGQPLLVQWPAEARAAMGFAEPFASDPESVEVLYPVFEGLIHRLDLKTGAVTKPPIEGSCPFKGTGSVDPRGYPLLYAGQGLPDR
ncbi:MAG: hypothetical protein LBL01_04770, partial [Bifidobacteriaceae bacterium]|nr:hypothetical protein [Bifidobacteriaceae bacterium]